jgi:hypothetical protein
MHILIMIILFGFGIGFIANDNLFGFFLIGGGVWIWKSGGREWKIQRDDFTALFFGLGVLACFVMLLIEFGGWLFS